MKHLDYNFKKKPNLNFGNEMRTPLRPFVPKGKDAGYYHETRRGLGCVSTPIQLDSGYEELVCYGHSSDTSSWVPDVSVGTIFEGLFVNMVLTFHLEDE